MTFYITRLWVKIGLWFYYRQIFITGAHHIPKEGGIIYIGNHQNAFLDAILPACYLPGVLNFLARADVFKGKVGKFLNKIHVLPILRKRDGLDTFKESARELDMYTNLIGSGQRLLLFPEANQVLAHKLRPLSKGYLRIALEAAKNNNFEKPLFILPYAVNYEDYFKAGGAVSIVVGAPINFIDYKADFEANENKTINQLNKRCAEAMASVMVNIEPEVEAFYFKNKNFSAKQLTDPSFFVDDKSYLNVSNLDKSRKVGVKPLALLLHLPVGLAVHFVVKKYIKINLFEGSARFLSGLIFSTIYYLLIVAVLFAFGLTLLQVLLVVITMMLILKINII